MMFPDFDKRDVLSTPQQAESLQRAIEDLVADREASEYSSSIGISCKDIETPHAIDIHMPPGGVDSHSVTDSAYIQFMLEWKTGKPVTDGVVGMVSFTRRDEVAKGIIYAGHVNYHVLHTNGVFSVERHVTNTEHGRHMVTGALGRAARHAVDPATQLAELLDLKARIEESRPIEKAMGMFDVSAPEIEAMVAFVQDTNK